MQNYNVKLQSEIFKSFRCQRAANSLDIDVNKKSIHELNISVDIESEYNIGLIIGASGSGKTTLAKQIWGDNVFDFELDESKSIIDQLPEQLNYDECASILAGIGLTSVPCWIRPVYTLSNGQKSRAIAALMMTKNESLSVIDEWTSVVDRTVAKVMSHCVQKHARKNKKKIVLLSCHYDVVEWLNPDWIIDCNKQEFIDRRLLRLEERERKEQLKFDVREIDRKSWKYFSKYHYLSEHLPAGKSFYFGLFYNKEQIGINGAVNYVPWSNKKKPMVMHISRTVIHPDYAGIGLGIKFDTEVAKVVKKLGFDVRAKFSSIPFYKMMSKHKDWKLIKIERQIGKMSVGKTAIRKSGFRENIKTYSFKYIGS